ncbi:MAG: DUF721 domain-containing protein [Treponema sp.]|jgi:hypothetical protein|nr:DUF721 domain-containing protein [Treponema sp.]
MKHISNLLSLVFPPETLETMLQYTKISSAWRKDLPKYMPAAAVDHSKLISLDRGIISIEVEHATWLQLFQFQQRSLLEYFQQQFPETHITAITFHLKKHFENKTSASD